MNCRNYIKSDEALVEIAVFEQSHGGQEFLAGIQRRLDELIAKQDRPKIVREGDFSEDALGQLMEMRGLRFAMSLMRDAKHSLKKGS